MADTAFQADAFQNDAFQIAGESPATPAATEAVTGGLGWWPVVRPRTSPWRDGEDDALVLLG